MSKLGKYGVINIILHPHPEGAYYDLFQRAAKLSEQVNYFGDRFAKISPITQVRNGIFSGRIATWAEIDTDGNTIDKKTLDEMLFRDAGVDLPDNVGFNSRVFNFSFRISDHRFFVELLNDENERISIGSVAKIVRGLLENALSGGVSVEVRVVPQKSAVKYVLETTSLRKLEIEVALPNPDVLTESKAEIIDSMNLMHARKMRIELTRRADEQALQLSNGVESFAELAAEGNGYVRAIGRDEEGKTIERSTKPGIFIESRSDGVSSCF